MDTVQILFYILAAVGLLSALLQTFGPPAWKAFFKQQLDPFFSAFILKLIGLLFVTFMMILLVRSNRAREGFQDAPTTMTKTFQARLNALKAKEVCDIFTAIEKNIYESEKAPVSYTEDKKPIVPTDAEAKGKTEAILSKALPAGILRCEKLDALMAPSLTDDTLYGLISTVPDSLFVQIYQAAEYSAEETTSALARFKESLNVGAMEKPEATLFEGFKPLCTPDIAEERRKFLREKKLTEAQEQCLLPEEVPENEKIPALREKLDRLENEYNRFLALPYKNGSSPRDRPTISQQIQRYTTSKAELDRLKNKAESGTLQDEIKA